MPKPEKPQHLLVSPKNDQMSPEYEIDLELDELESCSGHQGLFPEDGDGIKELYAQSSKSFNTEEKNTLRRINLKILLIVSLLNFLTLADTTNIGYAKIAGVDVDLDINSDGLEMVLVIFYMGYIGCQWIGIFWKIIPAHIFVTAIAVTWGVSASLQSIASSADQILWLRASMGTAAAAVNSIPIYLAFLFRREELGLMIGIFSATVPLMTSFASLLALAVVKIGELLPIASWRLLFLLEGFPSIILAVLAWNIISDGSNAAAFLTMRKKEIAQSRIKDHFTAREEIYQSSRSKLRDFVVTIFDLKNYIAAAMFFLANLTFTSMPTFIMTRKTMSFSAMPCFLPTIVHELGYSVLTSHILSTPPYLLSCFMVIYTMHRSDSGQKRGYYICIHALISTIGYALVALGGFQSWGSWYLYFAIYPASMGHFSILSLIITWTLNNQSSYFKQIISFIMVQSIGQLALPIAVRLYPESDDPFYTKAMCICTGSMILIAMLAAILRLYLSGKNGQIIAKHSDSLKDEHIGFLNLSESVESRNFLL